MPDVLGLDYGSKYIGVAKAAGDTRVAHPYAVWANDDDFFSKLSELVVKGRVSTVVVGLPLNMDGNETTQAKRTREFGIELTSQLGVDVVYQAESGTSLAARSQKPGTERIDDRAAAIILNDYLANKPLGRAA